MNTQPPRQHEALSEEERELARVVRALPGGEPPAALDALILKAATDAVASSHPQKSSRWNKALLGTSALWLGTAAASVLTVGIGWQLFQSMSAPIYELPADENVSSAQVTDSAHKDESIAVEMIPAREPLPTSPPPEEAMAADAAATASVSVAKEKTKAVDSDRRARESSARQQMNDAQLAKKSDDGYREIRRDQAEQDWVPQISGIVAPAPAPAAPPPPMPAAVAAAPASASAHYGQNNDRELDRITVTGSKIRKVEAESAQPAQVISRSEISAAIKERIRPDSELVPEMWLDQIRNRVEKHDVEGAKASLKLYRETYPKLRIPEELKPLLK